MERPPVRPLAVALVLLVVALAGCSAVFDSGGGPTETADAGDLTPAPVPNVTATPTAVSSFPDAPPGVTVDGLADPLALREAHRSVVANRSFTVAYRRTLTADAGDPFAYTVAVGNRSRYLVTASDADETLVYADRSGRYERGFDLGADGVGNLTDEVTVTPTAVLQSPTPTGLEHLPADAAVTRIQRNGTTFYRFHATDPPADEEWTNFSATAYVRADGLVKTVDVSYDRESEEDGSERDGRPRHFEYRFTYAAVGSTDVSAPAWARRLKRTRSTAGPDGYPQGLGPGGVESVYDLWNAHRFVLGDRSFTLVRSGNATADVFPPTGSVAVANESTYLVRRSGAETVYADPSGRYVRESVGPNGTEARVRTEESRARPGFPFEAWSTGQFWFASGDATVTRVERDGGTRFLVAFESPPGTGRALDPTNFTATMLVRPSGLIEQITVDARVRAGATNGAFPLTNRTAPDGSPADGSAADGTAADGPADGTAEREWVDVTYRYEYRRVGNTTVAEPDWVTRAKRDETGATPRRRNGTGATPRREALGVPYVFVRNNVFP